MATKIVTKNSSTASAVPTASDLVQGELAVNVADKKLFTEDNSGAIIELADGVKLAGIEASADVTDTANVTAAGALMDSELTSEASVKALDQGVATTDSPAFAGLTVDTDTLAVDSTNNRVGIGTSSPSSELHIASASPVLTLQDTDSTEPLSTYVSFKDSGGNEHGWMGYGSSLADSLQIANTHDDIILYTGSSGTASERMRVDSAGNVGIGTASPSFELSVHESSANADARIQLTNADTGTGTGDGFQIIMNGANAGRQVNLLNREASPMAFWTNNAERMRIDSSGNVGIGTSSPTDKLEVNGNIKINTGTADGGQLILSSAGYSDWNNDNTNGAWRLYNGATERMRIDGSGNVGIGGTPTAPLHVFGGGILGASSTNPIAFTGSTGSNAGIGSYNANTDFNVYTAGTGVIKFKNAATWNSSGVLTSTGTERMRIDSSGYITSLPTYNNGSASSANMVVNSSGLFLRSVSSGKYKTNVEDVQDSYVDSLLKIRPVYYRSLLENDNSEHSHWGFIAEEVAEIDPRLVHYKTVDVSYTDDGEPVKTELKTPEPEGVQYERFIPLMLKLIQNQQTLIESLTARIAALEE